jgi:hypothetical protein
MIMSDDDIEAMLRGLVEQHLAEDAAKRRSTGWKSVPSPIRRCKTLDC